MKYEDLFNDLDNLINKIQEEAEYYKEYTNNEKEEIDKLGNAKIYYKQKKKLNPNILSIYIFGSISHFRSQNQLNSHDWTLETFEYVNKTLNSKIYNGKIKKINSFLEFSKLTPEQINFYESFKGKIKKIIKYISYGVEFGLLENKYFLDRYFKGLVEDQLNNGEDISCIFALFQIPYNFGDKFYSDILNYVKNSTAHNGMILTTHCLLNEEISTTVKETVYENDFNNCENLIQFVLNLNFNYLKSRYPIQFRELIETLYHHMKPEVKAKLQTAFIYADQSNDPDGWINKMNGNVIGTNQDFNYKSWDEMIEGHIIEKYQSNEEYFPPLKLKTVKINNQVYKDTKGWAFENTKLFSIKNNDHILNEQLIEEVSTSLRTHLQNLFYIAHAQRDTTKLFNCVFTYIDEIEDLTNINADELDENEIYRKFIKNAPDEILNNEINNIVLSQEDTFEELNEIEPNNCQLDNIEENENDIADLLENIENDEIEEDMLNKLIDLTDTCPMESGEEVDSDIDEAIVDLYEPQESKNQDSEDETKESEDENESQESKKIKDISINFIGKDIEDCIAKVSFFREKKYTYDVDCYKADVNIFHASLPDTYAVVDNKEITLQNEGGCLESIATIIAVQAYYNVFLKDKLEYKDTVCKTVLEKNNLIRKYEIELG